MFRIASSGDTLIVDEEGRSQGRGAYLHYRNRCITSFGHSKAKVLQSLKRRVSRDERFKLVELIHARLDSRGALE